MVKVGVNGFGRIGRISFRLWLLKHMEVMDIVAINTSGSMGVRGWAHLVNWDTMYGRFEYDVSFEEVRDPKETSEEDPLIGYLKVPQKDKKIAVLAQRDPSKIPWSKWGVEVVIESTGVFRTKEEAGKHALGGAKRVVISAPSKGGNVSTYVLGVNEYKGEQVINNASCTTNCVAPICAVMHGRFGIKRAMLTTVHGYTDDQNLQDNSHKDLRRARAAAENIIPTTTGAAKATIETIPELEGIFDGMAIRVPVATGSLSDFVFLVSREVTLEEVNNAFEEASKSPLFKGVLGVTREPLVSSDIVGRSESAVVDLESTRVVGGDMVKVLAWYDNEWGYANRLLEQVVRVGKSLGENKVPMDPISLSFK
jgi:glyceraldehyde 3-phosphate dehydrogenase